MATIPMEVESVLIYGLIISFTCFFAWAFTKYQEYRRKKKKNRSHKMLRDRAVASKK